MRMDPLPILYKRKAFMWNEVDKVDCILQVLGPSGSGYGARSLTKKLRVQSQLTV